MAQKTVKKVVKPEQKKVTAQKVETAQVEQKDVVKHTPTQPTIPEKKQEAKKTTSVVEKEFTVTENYYASKGARNVILKDKETGIDIALKFAEGDASPDLFVLLSTVKVVFHVG